MDGELQQPDGELELLPEDVETFLSKIKVTGSISSQRFTFPEVFNFQ
jgi:hypothetical protein